jgi:hypothetical protein
MKKHFTFLTLIVLLFSQITVHAAKDQEVDICVYGGSSSGIIAAYTAKKLGKTVVVIEPGKYIGGLTTGGLGATDIGNKYAVTGLAKDFYRRIGAYYGKFEQWTFEPHVADQVYADLIREAGLEIVRNYRLHSVKKDGEWIREITVENSDKPSSATNRVIRAKMFIDGTYEGDLMAKAGVSYTLGRESNSQYGETYNGVQVSDFHQLPDGIDPYKIEGNAKSGLVWGVSNEPLAATGSGDKKIQAYNFRLCLTKDKNNQIPFKKPDNYRRDRYELLSRIIKKEAWTTIHSSFTVNKLEDNKISVAHQGGFLIKDMPRGKTDFNNFGGFSTDMIGANYEYPEGDYSKRKKIWKEHEDYTKGLLYFLGHDPSIPAHIRDEMNSWGFPKDEFKDLGGFSNQLYVREARRMVGDVVMTQKHCEGVEVVNDQIGMAAYGMDSHNIQRIIINGMVKNEGDVQKGVRYPFPISYRSIVPKIGECKNLLVPVCLSASHIAFGSIRMEPVFMVLGQSAATAAVVAMDAKTDVQHVDVARVQQILTADPLVNGSTPELLVDNDDPRFVTVTGNWTENRGGYGRTHLMSAASPNATHSVRYAPVINKAGTYEIWMYFSNFKVLSDKIQVTVKAGDTTRDVTINVGDITELGLPSGDWVTLGKYDLKPGSQTSVTISGKGTDKSVVADALIWKPVAR